MKSIVDQHGKPFKPNPFSRLSARTMHLAAIELEKLAQPSRFEEMHRIEQLRQSCGAPPQTITFRRHSALTKEPA